MAKNCCFKAVDAETHKSEYVRDAFIAGLVSQDTRRRLLEFESLNYDEAVTKAKILENANLQAKSYTSYHSLMAAEESKTTSDGEEFQEKVLLLW